ncbi:MAG: 30S ribosomal protein S12 methylthiotransferase RimO [Gemmatimonadota bacterium]
MRFHVVTLGCDKNTVDSERYSAELVAHGATMVGEPATADLIVINTCGFIDAAKKESIDAIIGAAALKDIGQVRCVAAVGCLVERHKAELGESIPEVDFFLGASETDRLVGEVIARGLLEAGPLVSHPGTRLYDGSTPHVRYLKISEGCDHGCAFCAIPLMRGRHRSFDPDEVIREAQLLDAQGAREINLVAQDLAHYGRDRRDGSRLADLLRRLVAETSVPWYRLLYIYSAGLTDEVVDLIAAGDRIVPYLDIPMQHGVDSVLARMRRPERRSRQLARIAALRDRIPGLAIRSTVIVGFPGETVEEFDGLLSFLEEAQLDRLGVFGYSPQEGTRAAAMEDDVPDEVKRERVELALELQRLITEERYERLTGRIERVMIDRISESGRAEGRTTGQADDIDGITLVDSLHEPGTIIEARIEEVVNGHDFVAVEAGVLNAAPVRGSAGHRRILPIAPASMGSFGVRR